MSNLQNIIQGDPNNCSNCRIAILRAGFRIRSDIDRIQPFDNPEYSVDIIIVVDHEHFLDTIVVNHEYFVGIIIVYLENFS